jgi:hypothetical protein
MDPGGEGAGARWNAETGNWEQGAADPYPSYSPPSGPRRPRNTALLGTAVVLVLLAVGVVGGWMMWGRDSGGNRADRSAQASTAAPSVTEQRSAQETLQQPDEDSGEDPEVTRTTPAPSSGEPSDVPAGYIPVQDEAGFSAVVPGDWRRTREGSQVFYTSTDGRHMLQVSLPSTPELTPYQALRGASDHLASVSPGYVQIRLEEIPGQQAAQLIYAYDSATLGERRQAADVAFQATDHRQYAFLVIGPAAEWPQQTETLRIALNGFAPGE